MLKTLNFFYNIEYIKSRRIIVFYLDILIIFAEYKVMNDITRKEKLHISEKRNLENYISCNENYLCGKQT